MGLLGALGHVGVMRGFCASYKGGDAPVIGDVALAFVELVRG